MKIIPRFYHGVLDYVVGLFLLLAPKLLGFSDLDGAAVWVPRIVGLMILLQAMTTKYELGVLKVMPISMHLMTDYVVGLFLLAAPWLFGFSEVRVAMVTVVVVGLLVLGLTAMTQPAGRPRELLA
jgi:SPW repeat